MPNVPLNISTPHRHTIKINNNVPSYIINDYDSSGGVTMNESQEIELERSLVYGWRRKIIEHDIKTNIIPKTLINYSGFSEREELEFYESMEEGILDYEIT